MRSSEARVAAIYRERREHRAGRRHGDRARRRSVLRRSDAGHPRRDEGNAEARGPGQARRDRRRRQHRLPAGADARGGEPGQADRARLEARAPDLRAAAQHDRAERRRRRRGTAGRGEHRQRRRVLRAHQLRGSQHPVGDAGQAPRRAARHGADQPAGLCRPDGRRARSTSRSRRRRSPSARCSRYVRRGDVVQVHSLRRGAAEAMETIAHGLRGGKVVGRPIEDIRLPEGATIVHARARRRR